MRKPNGFSASASTPESDDDLGWNDFGADERADECTGGQAGAWLEGHGDNVHALPEVLRRIQQIAARLNRPRIPAAASTPVPEEARRVAFTVHLDGDRHFRLRMAGVLLDRSAQSIVTEALDHYLSDIPEVAASSAYSEPVTKRRGMRAQES